MELLQGSSYPTLPWLIHVVLSLHFLVINDGEQLRTLLTTMGVDLNNSSSIRVVHETCRSELEVCFLCDFVSDFDLIYLFLLHRLGFSLRGGGLSRRIWSV